MNSLNIKQKIFIDRYLISFCAKRAYKEAYGCTNNRTAESNGHRLLRNAEVQEALRKASIDITKRNQLDQDWIVSRLKAIADGNFAKIINLGNSPTIKIDLKESDLYPISKIKVRDNYFEIRIRDPLKALYLLGKYLNLWNEANFASNKKDYHSSKPQDFNRYIQQIVTRYTDKAK